VCARPCGTAEYVPAEIEKHWQSTWQQEDVFATPPPRQGGRDVYVYPAQPFTSGAAHMGHVRSYTIADAYARFHRARGNAVLFTLGFDAFGLPAELSAVKRGESPRKWVQICRDRMAGQFRRLGYSFDWSRSYVTCEEDSYRWTQWMFLTLFEAGMIYRAPALVDWCHGCRSVLPGLQIEDGLCARCGQPVGLAELPQWHLRVAAYADEAAERLGSFSRWSRLAVGSQRDAVGVVEGVELEVRDVVDGRSLTVFTPHAAAIGAASFVAVSPRHPRLSKWIGESEIEAALGKLGATPRSRAERKLEALPIAETGHRVRLEGVARELPVIVTPAVDSRFGPTAALGIPAADRTDAALADRMAYAAPQSGGGSAVARPARRYRVQDFVLSRQRSWGAPVPVVHCDPCGIVPVPFESLPVRLPDDLTTVRGEPGSLAEHPTFSDHDCPSCGGPARRDTDTLDCHSDALWVWMSPCLRPDERQAGFFDSPELARWLPVDLVVYGSDLGDVMYDIRVGTKALRDAGVLDWLSQGEPFDGVLMHEMVHMEGRKMSKHLGNVIDPEQLIAEYGADTLRLASLFAAAPARPINWTDQPLRQCSEFLGRVWDKCLDWQRLCLDAPPDAEVVSDEQLRARLERWCRTAVERLTRELEAAEMHRATRDLMFFFDRLVLFERSAIARRGELDGRDREGLAHGIRLFLVLLAPFAPHLAEELWARMGAEEMLAAHPWPVVEEVAA
jgi:leucyl-tRNA synthetase